MTILEINNVWGRPILFEDPYLVDNHAHNVGRQVYCFSPQQDGVILRAQHG